MIEKKLKSFLLRKKLWSKQMRNVFHDFKHYKDIEYAFSGTEIIDHAYHIHNTPDNVYRLLVKIIPSIIELSKEKNLNILVTNNESKNRPLKEYMKLLGITNINYYNISNIKYIHDLQRLPFNKLHAGPGCALTCDVLERYRNLITTPSTCKKIVIVRKNNRSIPENIMLFLLKNGYTPVELEDMSVQDQVNLFAGITHVVGVQGAGFVNLIYCSQGVKSLELSAGFDLNLYTNLAEHINQMLGYKDKIIHNRIDRDEVFVDPYFTTNHSKMQRKCMFYDTPIRLSYIRFIEEFGKHMS